PDLLRWTMWPATALMVAGGMTDLALRWRSVARALSAMPAGAAAAEDPDLSTGAIAAGSAVAAAVLVAVQHFGAGVPFWLAIAAVALSAPLLLVGTRVLGETNWAPITALAHLGQAVLAALAPGNATVNMAGSAVAGAVPASGEHMMQNFRAAHLLGARSRPIVFVQLAAVLV